MEDLYTKLDELYEAGDKDGVEKYLTSIVNIGQRFCCTVDTQFLAALNELGGFYRGVSRYRESERAFKTALDHVATYLGNTTAEYATVLCNLAGTYRLEGNTDLAIESFLKAKGIYEEIGETESYEYLSNINNIALAYAAAGDTDKAKEMFLLAYEGAPRFGSHEEATSLVNLAGIYMQTGDINSASDYVTKAIDIYDAMGEENVHHASALNIRAQVYFHRGDFANAEKDFERSVALSDHYFGKNVEYAHALTGRALSLKQLGRNDEAKACYSEAYDVFVRIFGKDHPFSVNTLKHVNAL